MNEENKKLKNIKKSSNVALILARIAKIFCIVAVVLCMGSGIGFIVFNDYLNTELAQAEAEGYISMEEVMQEFNDSEFLLSFVDSGQFGKTLGIYLLVYGVLLIILAVILHFVSRVFRQIQESDSPFRRPVLKNLIVVFVLITLLTLQSSLLIGAVVGFSLWCVYCVFDYGCELQRLSDETL